MDERTRAGGKRDHVADQAAGDERRRRVRRGTRGRVHGRARGSPGRNCAARWACWACWACWAHSARRAPGSCPRTRLSSMAWSSRTGCPNRSNRTTQPEVGCLPWLAGRAVAAAAVTVTAGAAEAARAAGRSAARTAAARTAALRRLRRALRRRLRPRRRPLRGRADRDRDRVESAPAGRVGDLDADVVDPLLREGHRRGARRRRTLRAVEVPAVRETSGVRRARRR